MNKKQDVLSWSSSLLLVANYMINYNFVIPLILQLGFDRGIFSLDDNTPEMIAYIAVLLFTAAISWPALRYGWLRYISRYKENTKQIFIHFGIMLGVTIITSYLVGLITGLDTSVNESEINYYFENAPYYYTFVAVVFAPIVEECVFRLAIHRRLASSGYKGTGILIASVLFGFIHVYSSLFSGNYLDLVFMIVYSSMGLVISLLYERTGSLWCCILLHMLNNAVASLV